MGYIHVTTTILKRLWNCVNCKYARVYLCIASPLVLKKVSKCLGTEETGCWIDGKGTQMLLMHTFYLNGDTNLDQHRLVLTLHLKTLQSVSNNRIRNGPKTPHRSCYIPTFHYSTQPPCVRVADYQIWPKITQNFSPIFKHHLHLSFQKTAVVKRSCYLWHPARHPLLWLWREGTVHSVGWCCSETPVWKDQPRHCIIH